MDYIQKTYGMAREIKKALYKGIKIYKALLTVFDSLIVYFIAYALLSALL